MKYEFEDRPFGHKLVELGEKISNLVVVDADLQRATETYFFKEKFPNNKLVVLFQPHRYSRTQHCWHEFTTCFTQADEVILTDIYAAGESPVPGVSSEILAGELKHSHAQYLPKDAELAQKISSQLKSGDIFLTLGAGDGWKVGMEVLGLCSEIKTN